MTRKTNARLAGFMFLFYIATAFAGMVLFDQAADGEGTAARLASIAQHAPRLRLAAVLTGVTILDALMLAVALYALTRDCDADLALLALSCRIAEGVTNAVPVIAMMALLALAKGAAGAVAVDAAAANALGTLLLKVQGWSTLVGATLFAVGSTLYSYLFLRARTIPVLLAWLGVIASVLLVVGLPLETVGFIKRPVNSLMWIPVVAFELILGLWLLIKGVRVES
jgi:hypothetical protein